jgi:hypothetical protein
MFLSFSTVKLADNTKVNTTPFARQQSNLSCVVSYSLSLRGLPYSAIAGRKCTSNSRHEISFIRLSLSLALPLHPSLRIQDVRKLRIVISKYHLAERNWLPLQAIYWYVNSFYRNPQIYDLDEGVAIRRKKTRRVSLFSDSFHLWTLWFTECIFKMWMLKKKNIYIYIYIIFFPQVRNF